MEKQRQQEEEARLQQEEQARLMQQEQEQEQQEIARLQPEPAPAPQPEPAPAPPPPQQEAPPLPPQQHDQQGNGTLLCSPLSQGRCCVSEHNVHNQEMAEPSNEMIPPNMRKALPARPTTARRAPPKLPTKEVKVTNRGPKENVEGATEVSAGITSGLITEDMDDDDDDDANVEVPITAPLAGFDDKEEEVGLDEDGVHGKLVGDILAEKKQLQNEQQQQGVPEPQPEEQPQGIVIKKRRSSVEGVQRPGASVTAKPSAAATNDVDSVVVSGG